MIITALGINSADLPSAIFPLLADIDSLAFPIRKAK